MLASGFSGRPVHALDVVGDVGLSVQRQPITAITDYLPWFDAVADAIGYDARIGRRLLSAGLGFGGGCLPKDIRAFMARAGELGVDQALTFLREVDSINMRRRVRMVDLAPIVGDAVPSAVAAGLGLVRRGRRSFLDTILEWENLDWWESLRVWRE